MAASFKRYGSSLYVGIGIPIPVLATQVAQSTGISDEEILTTLLDYSVLSRKRPVLRPVSYAELKSGVIDIKGIKGASRYFRK